MILDQYGQPMRMPSKADLLERQAVPGLGSVRQITSGHPADGLEPVRLAAILRQAENQDATSYLELAEQMEEKDLHYAAVLGVRKRAIRALELRVDPGDDTDEAEEAAGIVRQTLDTAAVKSDLIDMLDAIGKGYSVTEIIWDYDGAWKVVGLEAIDPRWFEFDQVTGRQLLLRDNAGLQPLRPYKFIVHRARAKSGLPIRSGLARLASWAYLFKNFNIRDWAIFIEAYGHPLRLGKYDTHATPEERRELLKAVRQIGVDMAAIVPKSMEVEIVAGSITGAHELYEKNARYWDEQISKGVLGQVATTDAISGGHAVGKIHEEVRNDIRDADAEQLAATLMRDVAFPLTKLYFGERQVAIPRIRFIWPEQIDPKLLLELMGKAGGMGLRIAKADVYRAFNLREPADDEDVLDIPAPPAPPPVGQQLALPKPGIGKGKQPAERQTAARQADAPAVDAIDALVDELLASGDMQRVMEGEIGGMLEALLAATDMDQVRDILAAFDGAAPDPLQDLLTRATFAARMAGEVGAEIRD